MSKAILVLDEMPEGCKRCPLSIVRFKEYGAECVVKMATVGPRFDWNRPSWCPLKEVEVKVVQYAEWLYVDEYDDMRRCSECDFVVKAENISQYCPHCGAEMDGGI